MKASLEQKIAMLDSIDKNKVFSVTFIKKNGEVRHMNCRFGVTKYLRGGESTTAHIPSIVTVFDMQKKQYRNINLETLKSVRYNGREETFD